MVSLCSYLFMLTARSGTAMQKNVMAVVDTSGSNVALLKSEWLKQGAGQDYHFRIPVTGLKRGRYYVQISNVGGMMVRKEFDI